MKNVNDNVWLVKLEFKRVQTYLFAVSELRAMIGANTLMGEVLRGCLLPDGKGFCSKVSRTKRGITESAKDAVPESELEVDNLPALAVRYGATMPTGVKKRIPGLFEHLTSDAQDRKLLHGDCDDPAASYRHGVLVRDGGHLHAVFPNDQMATQFIGAARRLLAQRLPGLEANATMEPVVAIDGHWIGWRDARERLKQEQRESLERTIELMECAPFGAGESPFSAPQFQVCEITGLGPASAEDRPENRPARVSTSVARKEEAATRFNKSESYDILGMMRRAVLEAISPKLTPFQHLSKRDRSRDVFPVEFNRIGRSGYLAVIAADGNNIGDRSKKVREELSTADFFEREARGERFFHETRNIVRRALVDALGNTFRLIVPKTELPDNFELPFRLLMVGGDDVLVLCDAVFGPDLLVNYATQIEELAKQRKHELTIGAGMAIVKRSFPFHQTHALAEELIGSAKRLVRDGTSTKLSARSTVDWLSVSESWYENIRAVRKRDYVHSYQVGSDEEAIVLSGKPYPITGHGDWTLERLWAMATKSVQENEEVPRAQLRGFGEAIPKGRRQAEHVFATMPDKLRAALCDLGDGGPWIDCGNRHFLTRVLDFLELFELARLRKIQLMKSGHIEEPVP